MKKIVFIFSMFLLGFAIDANAQCVQGNCHNGNGKFVFENGDTYQGSWKEGKPSGNGRYDFADGAYYRGDMKEGKFTGDGTYIWKDMSKYEGNWKDGKREGFGKFTWVNGDNYYGHWSADLIVDTEVKETAECTSKPTIDN